MRSTSYSFRRVLALATSACLLVHTVLVQAAPASELVPAPAPYIATADPALWPASVSPPEITTSQTEAAITALLARMTIEQKIGQLVQADISAIKPADLARYPLGSVLAGGNSGPYGNERASAAQWAKLVSEFRRASRKAGAQIPILFGVDAVHGHSNLPGATIFPHNIGLGAARDPDLVLRIGTATAAEISGSGIEWTFAPTLAVPQDMRWGRAYEGYAADPALVARYARAMTMGLQGQMTSGKPLDAKRVAATAKHFLADGGTADGRDQGDARITEAELIAKHAQGYPAAINAGALTVMASFSSWNGIKHHGNASLLTDVLKGRMGFAGLVVGDWNGHGQIPGCSATQCPDAINAGLDMFMAPDSWKGIFDSTLAAARDGRIPMARIDDAVRRIVRVKYKLGLMGKKQTQRGDTRQIGAPSHLELAREAVSKSLVLLKNNDATLPINGQSRVLITGPGADNMAMQAGGWTITWQGTDTTAADFPNGQTIGRAIADAVKANGGTATISSDGRFDVRPDVAVVVVGEKPYAEFEGDAPDLAFRMKAEDEALIAQLKSKGIRVVTLFISGRPMFTGKLINQSDAFVAAWLPGTQGRGIADVLIAGPDGKPRRDFSGRLPFAWPQDARSPISSPLFAEGYGLNYTQNTKIGGVNEVPGVSLSTLDQANNFMVRGKVPAPWRLVQDGSVASRPVDMGAQENAVQIAWNQPGSVAIEGPAVDLSQQLAAGNDLVIEWRIDAAATGPVLLSLAGSSYDMRSVIDKAIIGNSVETRIPLRCFSAKGANLAAVGSPIRIQASKGLAASLRTIHVKTGNPGSICPDKTR